MPVFLFLLLSLRIFSAALHALFVAIGSTVAGQTVRGGANLANIRGQRFLHRIILPRDGRLLLARHG